MKTVFNKIVIISCILVISIVSLFACTAVDEVKKLKGKGYQESNIHFSSDYETWTVEMVRKDENGITVDEVSITKCKTLQATKTYYEFYKSKNSNKTVKKRGTKVYIGSKDSVNDALGR